MIDQRMKIEMKLNPSLDNDVSSHLCRGIWLLLTLSYVFDHYESYNIVCMYFVYELF